MGFTSHRGFESRPLRSLRSVRRPHRVAAILGERLAPVAQLDRASVYGTEGHRFESCRARRGTPATAGLLGFLEPNFANSRARNRTRYAAGNRTRWAVSSPSHPHAPPKSGRCCQANGAPRPALSEPRETTSADSCARGAAATPAIAEPPLVGAAADPLVLRGNKPK